MKNTRKKGASGCLLGIIFLLLIAGLAAGGAYLWYNSAVNNPANNEEGTTEIVVEDGKGLLDIAEELEAKKLLSSALALRVYLRLENPEIKLLPGKYTLNNQINIPQLIEALNSGPKLTSIRVTIQEGLRYDEVVAIFRKAFRNIEDTRFDVNEYEKIVKAPKNYTFNSEVQAFLDKHKPANKNLEGFLYPDTYVIGTDATAIDVLNLQIGTLIRRLREDGFDPEKTGRLKNFYEVLTLASILYREAGPVSQMPTVADIFIKRIENNIGLFADSTYLYPLRDWKYPLTSTELRNNYDNKYNTYLYPGLTPTPISNPGVEAIEATLKPKRNDYFFFITGKDGKNYYARTFPEHEANIAKYLS